MKKTQRRHGHGKPRAQRKASAARRPAKAHACPIARRPLPAVRWRHGLSLYQPVATLAAKGRARARAAVAAYGEEETLAFVLLLMPFFLIAFAIGMKETIRFNALFAEIAAVEPSQVRDMPPDEDRAALQPVASVRELALVRDEPEAAHASALPATALGPVFEPPAGLTASDAVAAAADSQLPPSLRPSPITAAELLPSSSASVVLAAAAPPSDGPRQSSVTTRTVLLASDARPRPLAPHRRPMAALAEHVTSPATITPERDARLLAPSTSRDPLSERPGGPVLLVYALPDGIEPGVSMCVAKKAASATAVRVPVSAGFGLRLAAAARAQTEEFVIYDDSYRSIPYPMGDVKPLYGVCTDVVIRAYRTLGIDLQELVHRVRAGRGDRNIDHRRVEILRRFFLRHAEVLPASDFGEDYQPGDIVTYHRPQNRNSKSHIAIVASERGPSGNLMIIHNRGWGPQVEDALFVDEITGHFRFREPPPALADANAKSAGRASDSARATSLAQASLPVSRR